MKTSKHTDCSICPLVDEARCLVDTNSPQDITKTEIMIFSDAPSYEAIEQNKPLAGKAKQVLQEAFQLTQLDKFKYTITNVVLCANIANKCSLPSPNEAIVCCKPNWEAMVDMIKPKVILLMGSTPMKSFGFSQDDVVTSRGKFYKYKDIPVMITIHPSQVAEQCQLFKSEPGGWFIDDINKIMEILSPTVKVDDEQFEEEWQNATEAADDYYYKDNNAKEDFRVVGSQKTPYAIGLPQWCYEETVCLFDIQSVFTENSIIYTFKTPTGKKYHKVEATENYYYIGNETEIGDAPMLTSVDKVNLVLGASPTAPESATFESDVKPEVKRAIDYRFTRKTEEPDIPLVKMYADIEVYNKRSRRFPDPKKAESPINAISFKIDNSPVTVWVCRLPQMDQKDVVVPEGVVYKTYSSEYNLLQAFAKLVKETNPDILTGWNFIGFDMLTIYGRMVKLGVDPNMMSPMGITHVDLKRYGRVYVYGLHVMDMLDLYKELTYSVEESYKLDFIAEKQLGTGKVSYSGTLDQLYEENISEFIRYSAVDTDLLYKLDKKMGHIDLKYELVRICATTWKTAESTMGLIDPLCISYAKNQNLVCRNAVIKANDTTIPGAYVRNPVKGRHNYVIDLDFASLYPSIICSCNIGPNTYTAKIDAGIAHQIIYCRDRLNPNTEIDIILAPLKKNFVKRKTTIGQLLATIDQKKSIVTSAGTIYKNHSEEVSFLNKILSYLLSSRSQYKDSMKDAKRGGDDSKFKRFGNMQVSYKILANSIYGVLANHAFRFFNNDMAMSITLTGQEVIKYSGWHLGQYLKTGETDINPDFLRGYEEARIPYLIYTDTDSIFIALGDYLADQGKL